MLLTHITKLVPSASARPTPCTSCEICGYKKRETLLLLFCARDRTCAVGVGSADTLHSLRNMWIQKKRNIVVPLLCPGQDLNLHSLRNTHLKRTRLPIPPPGHSLFFSRLVPRTRLELARRYRHYPLKVACIPISPPGLLSFKSGCKSTLFFVTDKIYFQIT